MDCRCRGAGAIAVPTLKQSKAADHCFEGCQRLRYELRFSFIRDEEWLGHLIDEP